MVFGNDYLNNHNWVELWDDATGEWVHVNTPPGSNQPNVGLCTYSSATGCDWSNTTGCQHVSNLGRFVCGSSKRPRHASLPNLSSLPPCLPPLSHTHLPPASLPPPEPPNPRTPDHRVFFVSGPASGA